MKKVFDVIRKKWVTATPEEIVRQTWIHRLIAEKQFPKELLSIEKPLKALFLEIGIERDVPGRRVDVLCFMKMEGVMKPLLLLECKKERLTREALDQVVSYNHYVKAPYVAIVNLEAIMLYSKTQVYDFLPSFAELSCG